MKNISTPEAIRQESFNPNAVGHLEFNSEDGTFTYKTGAPTVGSGKVIKEATQQGFAAQANPCVPPTLDEMYAQVFESDILKDKTILFCGIGSVGSELALRFAREGVGNFILVDFDRMELHNLSRHIGGVADIGRLKTDIVEEAILKKNPYARVEKKTIDMTNDPERLAVLIAKADLTYCSTDNTASRYTLSSQAKKAGKTVIYGWAETRAEGLDVFIQRPDDACYGCVAATGLITDEEITNEASARADGTIPAYTTPAEADALVQIGLPSDIDPLINLMIKLGLTELCRGQEDANLCGLDEELRPLNFFTWANRRGKHHARYNPFNEPKNGPTILRWYGCTIPRIPTCGLCAY